MTKADSNLDERFMKMALTLAARGVPSPNPPVGAVVVDAEGEVIGKGFHLEAGQPHAEALALEQAAEKAAGGTLYVSLEPCNHAGKTPPCVETILAAGIKRVVVGCKDPNPHVDGGGAERLGEAGLDVEVGVMGTEAIKLIGPWSKFITTGVPHVALKLALSLDGRIATRTGASKWVTGPEARVKVQQLRTRHDAVAIGIGTAIADDPRLTVRDETLLKTMRAPVRVIFDTFLRLPMTSRLVTTAHECPTWICAGSDADVDLEKALVDAGCSVLRIPQSGEGRVDVNAALLKLGEAGLVNVLFEGGAELAGSLLAGQHADELHAFVAPILLGPRGRPGAVDWAGPDTPTEAPRIDTPAWEVCGQDAYVYGRLDYPEKA